MDTKDEIMILVRDAVKTYNKKKVLNSLNMSVKGKSIYGLLGPSSCGKTTLLNCILAIKRLDSGFINLKVRSSKEIGYMPQELSLFENFTLEETISFFGSFFGLPEKTTRYRASDLADFLGISGLNSRLISTFSGGQKRRVSFLIALLHDATLLILDEPTVGMDCILSERIWQYLIKLSDQGKTIVITTHYIQEARHCNTIGLMRFGQLLEEKPPSELYAHYGTSNLEDIFLEICKLQDNNELNLPKIEGGLTARHEAKYRLFPENTCFDINRFKALLTKNVVWFRRNRLAAFGLALLPILLSLLYGLTMGTNPKGLHVALYSQELPGGQGLLPCHNMSMIYNEELHCYTPKFLTCSFVELLKEREIDIVPYDDYDTMIGDIVANKVWASLEVPKNFTPSITTRIEVGLKTQWDVAETSMMTARVDGTNSIIRFLLIGHFTDAIEQLYNDLLHTCGISEKIIPIQFKEPIFGSTEMHVDESNLPGFCSAFAFYLTLIYTTSAIMMEKVLGLLDRNAAAGMTYLEVVLAHLSVQVVVMLLQNLIMLTIFYEFFGYGFKGSGILAIIIMMSINSVGISFGFLLTEIFTKELTTAYAAIGATVTVFTTGGIIWPKEGMHTLLAWVQSYLPVSPVTQSLSSVILRGFGLTHRYVFPGFISNILWATIFAICTCIVHRMNKKM